MQMNVRVILLFIKFIVKIIIIQPMREFMAYCVNDRRTV
jgi:hypothetical protein